MAKRLALLVLVLTAIGVGATHARGGTSDVGTKFAWSGTIALDESIWLVDGGGCSGKIAVHVHRVLEVVKKSTVATVDDPRKGVWTMGVTAQQSGNAKATMSGALTCNGLRTAVSAAGWTSTLLPKEALTFRYDARKQKLEVVPTYRRELFVTGLVQSPSFNAREQVVGTYALPRLELHPSEDSTRDFRLRVKQATDPNKLKGGDAQYTSDSTGGGSFAGSPITSYLGFFGHVPAVGPRYEFIEHVETDLVGQVFGPDSDGDRVNDGADPNAFDADSDNDGFPDYWEASHGTNPNDAKSHPAGRCCHGAPDSDHDGYSDPLEIAHASDPNDPSSVPSGVSKDTTVTTTTTPPPPPTDWYGFTVGSVRCITTGTDQNGDELVAARVAVQMWVVTGKLGHLVEHMRARSRLELPVGLHYFQAWATVTTPYLLEGKHTYNFNLKTPSQNSNVTTQGGQQFRVHVQMTWERPAPFPDIDKNYMLALPKTCPKA